MVAYPAIKKALTAGTLVIIAGTTNGYVAEEVLKTIGQSAGFSRSRFFRGITLPPSPSKTESGKSPDEGRFSGDVVIVDGTWRQGKTIFEVAEELREGDVILKGANAVDLARRRAAILIGHPKGGTIGVALQAVIGRRVGLILPVGVEKRVSADIDQLAAMLNAPGAQGPRFYPAPGEIFTELDAISLLTGAAASLVAGGGVCGAEGSVWIAVAGSAEQEAAARTILKEVSSEPNFTL